MFLQQEEHLLTVRNAKIQMEARTLAKEIRAGELSQKDLTKYKLEMLREMCDHLDLTAIATGKHGRIIKIDYIKALQDSTALVRIPQKGEKLIFAQADNWMKTPSMQGANVSDNPPNILDTEAREKLIFAQADNRMKTPSVEGANVSDDPPNILDTEAPAPPQSEDLAMEIETTFVPVQLEVTANSRSKKRKRINSGEDKEDMTPSGAVKRRKMVNQTVTTESFAFASVPNILVATPSREAETVIKEGKGDVHLY